MAFEPSKRTRPNNWKAAEKLLGPGEIREVGFGRAQGRRTRISAGGARKGQLAGRASGAASGRTTTSNAAPAARAAEQPVAPKKSAQSAPTKKAPPKKAAANKAPPAERKKKGRPQEATTSKFFVRAMARARRQLGNKDDLLGLADEAEKKSRKFRSGAGAQLLAELKTMLRLVRAYATNEYRDIPWESMALIVGGIVYVVSPIDLVPDGIPAAGFLDDAAVVAFVLTVVRDELSDFTRWEEGRVTAVAR